MDGWMTMLGRRVPVEVTDVNWIVILLCHVVGVVSCCCSGSMQDLSDGDHHVGICIVQSI